VYIDISDIEKEKELCVRLSKNVGSWDWDLLSNFDLEALKNFGFESEELDKLLDLRPDNEKDDEIPDVPEEPKSKLGEIYQLGNHRIMCGDATKKEDVEKLMDGKKADMVFTDPPYGIGYKDIQGKFDVIKNDISGNSEFYNFLIKALSTWRAGRGYICCNWISYLTFFRAMMEVGLPPKSCIIWDKEVPIQHLDKFYKQHEFIIYFGEFGSQKTLDGDVWRIRRETRKDHPTAKPIELCSRAIKYSSKIDNIVLDLFLGSGNTLIACEKLNRI
ncbi:unnamed protein product, partial [marine sediment metagenome]